MSWTSWDGEQTKFHFHILKRVWKVRWKCLTRHFHLTFHISKILKSTLSQDPDNFLEGCSWDAEWWKFLISWSHLKKSKQHFISLLTTRRLKSTCVGPWWLTTSWKGVPQMRSGDQWWPRFQVSSSVVALLSAGKASAAGGVWRRKNPTWWRTLTVENVQLVASSHTSNCLHCKRSKWGEGESSQFWSEIQRKFPNSLWFAHS